MIVADLHARVQRAVRVLEDHLDAPAQRQQVPAVQAGDVDAVIDDRALGRAFQAQDAAPGGGLAAAAFADQAQRLAAPDGEVDAVHRLHLAHLAAGDDALGDREMHAQAAHLQQRAALGTLASAHAAAPARSPMLVGCGNRRRNARPSADRLPAAAAPWRRPRSRTGSAGGTRSRRPAASGRAAAPRPDRAAPAAAGPAAAPTAAAPSCRDAAAVIDSPPRRFRRCARHTSRSPGWRSAPRRRGCG